MADVARRDLDEVTRAAAKMKEAREELRQAIVRAHESGETYRDIGAAAGLSHPRIIQIVHEVTGPK